MMVSSASPELRTVSSVVALLGGRGRRLEQQLGHADDAVHRRADLVAHVGEEVRLEPRGLGRLVAGVRHARLRRRPRPSHRPGCPTQPAMPPSLSGIDLDVTSTMRGVRPRYPSISKRRQSSPVTRIRVREIGDEPARVLRRR